MDCVLDIWLRASIKSHEFIADRFWREQVGDMRHVYLPSAIIRVFEDNGVVAGFSAVVGDTLAALFVAPEHQGLGVGGILIADALACRSNFQLTVYSESTSSVRFYQVRNFVELSERLDGHTGHLEKVMRWTCES